MKSIFLIITLFLSIGVSAQGFFPYKAFKGIKKYNYEQALQVHPDSVIVLRFSQTDNVPKGVKRFKNLQSVHFYMCLDMDINKEIRKFSNNKKLVHISVKANYGTKFPEALFKLTQLKALELSGMSIGEIPNDIEKLSNLEYLSLGDEVFGGCKVKELPKTFSELHKLKFLSLWGNSDLVLEDHFYTLSNLEVLHMRYLQNFDFERLCKSFPNLQDLDLSDCPIKSLEGIEQLEKLSTLTIGGAEELETLGPNFHKLKSLTSLRISFRPNLLIEKELNSISLLRGLTSLDIFILSECGNKFPFPENGFEKLSKLRITTRTSTSLEKVIKSISFINSLEDLMLDNFNDTSLPKELFKMNHLKKLYLASVKLTELPEDICKLKLESLKIWNIQISALPNSILTMNQLQHLYLGNTKIIGSDPILKELHAKGVEIKGIKIQ